MKKGFTLIEALIALLLLTITVVGSMALYFYSDESMAIATHRRMAAELANSELENLKNTPYNTIVNATVNNVPIGDLMKGTKQTIVEAVPIWTDYEKVTVRISWYEGKNASLLETLDLVTYIAKP